MWTAGGEGTSVSIQYKILLLYIGGSVENQPTVENNVVPGGNAAAHGIKNQANGIIKKLED